MIESDGEKEERTDAWSDMSDPARAHAAAARLAHRASAPSEVSARRRFLDLLDPRPGEIVVDVGAGSGIIALDIAARVMPGGRVFAVDPSAPLLDHARASALAAGVGPMIDVRVADGRKLPFGPAGFDAAFSHWVLLHVDRPVEVVAEMKRVTRRGGRVMCVEMDWETAAVYPGHRGLTRRILHHATDRHVDGWMGRRVAPLFREVGFRNIVVEPIVNVDQGAGDRSWLEYLIERARIALDAKVISPTEASEWSLTLEAAFAGGHFFFSVTQFAVMGRVPG
jgi:ubiquinone/menaquinone biosynthesis C-methylase UbiE